MVKKLNLEKSFPNDLRKYSRNMVISDFCPINNAGWDIDTNIVYAPKSFIPRSASMNLTLDLFGQSVNLLEVNLMCLSQYFRDMYTTLNFMNIDWCPHREP